jgi:hypothetical protein
MILIGEIILAGWLNHHEMSNTEVLASEKGWPRALEDAILFAPAAYQCARSKGLL